MDQRRILQEHAEINLGTFKDERGLKEWLTSTFWHYQNRQKRPDWEKRLSDLNSEGLAPN